MAGGDDSRFPGHVWVSFIRSSVDAVVVNRSRGYLLVLVVLFAYFSWQLVVPFFQYVLGAILLAFVLYPLQERIEEYIPSAITAFLLVVLAVLGVIVPFVVIVAMFAEDAANVLQSIEPEDLQTAVIEDRIQQETGMEVNITETVTGSAEQIGSMVLEQTTAWFEVVTHALIGLGLALFLLYYLLKDGDDLLAWIHGRTPLPEDVQNDLYTDLKEVMWAVLAGHVLIAIIQGIIAGLGLFATGIPNASFWTFVMVVLALIPLIGAFMVWGPAVAYLVLTGQPVLGIALFVYSAIVVSISDDYLRPIVVDRYAQLSPAIIILGVLGGIYAFGVMGLFYGPVLLGALIKTIEVLDEHYERLETDETA